MHSQVIYIGVPAVHFQRTDYSLFYFLSYSWLPYILFAHANQLRVRTIIADISDKTSAKFNVTSFEALKL